MAATVATPLERSLGRIAGVTEMTSSSSLGSTRITLQFDLDRDIDGAARDVQAAINAARSLLPTGLPEQSDLSQGQSGRRADHDPGAHVGHDDAGADVRRGLDDHRAEALAGGRRRPGAASAAARCRRCASSSIRRRSTSTASASRTCARVLAATNANRPKGIGRGRRSPLADPGQRPGEDGRRLPAADRRLPQRRRGPAHRRRPRSSTRCRTCATPASSNGKPSVLVIINRQPNANIIETVDRVTAMLPQLRASIPSAIKLDVVMERTTTIRASLRDVERTLIIAVVPGRSSSCSSSCATGARR